jgi:hypothetical protein
MLRMHNSCRSSPDVDTVNAICSYSQLFDPHKKDVHPSRLRNCLQEFSHTTTPFSEIGRGRMGRLCVCA